MTVTSSSSSTDTTLTLDFGDKFKKPKGSWDCAICLVSNKAEDNKCVACQSEKPGMVLFIFSCCFQLSLCESCTEEKYVAFMEHFKQRDSQIQLMD